MRVRAAAYRGQMRSVRQDAPVRRRWLVQFVHISKLYFRPRRSFCESMTANILQFEKKKWSSAAVNRDRESDREQAHHSLICLTPFATVAHLLTRSASSHKERTDTTTATSISSFPHLHRLLVSPTRILPLSPCRTMVHLFILKPARAHFCENPLCPWGFQPVLVWWIFSLYCRLVSEKAAN